MRNGNGCIVAGVNIVKSCVLQLLIVVGFALQCFHCSVTTLCSFPCIILIDNSDFEVFSYNDDETKIVVMPTRDNISLEYDDTVILTFTPDDPGLISSLETAGEYIRDTATINIIDNDCKPITYLFLSHIQL